MKGSRTRAAVTSGAKHSGPATATQTATNQNGVTRSGLLHALDGFYAPTSVLFVMTTNHVETLNEALLRPGRIDYKLNLGRASDRQKIELCPQVLTRGSGV